MIKNKLAILYLLSGIVLLTACHENPLPKEDDQELTAQFLVKASEASEKKLDFKSSSESYWGRGYLDCIQEKVQDSRGCKILYQGMVAYAKREGTRLRKTITVGDLSDAQFQSHIESYYEGRLSFQLPKDNA